MKLFTFASSLCCVGPGDTGVGDGGDGDEDAGDVVATGDHLVEARHCLRSASGQERKTANATF